MTPARYQELLSRYRNDVGYNWTISAMRQAVSHGFSLDDFLEAVEFLRMADERDDRNKMRCSVCHRECVRDARGDWRCPSGCSGTTLGMVEDELGIRQKSRTMMLGIPVVSKEMHEAKGNWYCKPIPKDETQNDQD